MVYNGHPEAGRIEKYKKASPEDSRVKDRAVRMRHLRPTFLASMIADGQWEHTLPVLGHGKAGTTAVQGAEYSDLHVKSLETAGKQGP